MRYDSTCWTEVLGAAAGKPPDRESFSNRYGPVIRAYLSARWRLPFDHEDVSDASQEVFIQCFKSGGALEKLEPHRSGGFRAFLYGIARNIAAKSERTWARRRSHETLASSSVDLSRVEDADPSLSHVFDRAWAKLVTKEARALLAQRAAGDEESLERVRYLELRYQQGLLPNEIASSLGVDVRTVHRALERARTEFRTALVEVMASYNPEDTASDLLKKCADLLELL